MRKIRPGGRAWIELALFVSLRDSLLIYRKQATMSEVFGDALQHPIRRWPTVVSWCVITLHLFGCMIPEKLCFVKKFDPIGALARLLTCRLRSATVAS